MANEEVLTLSSPRWVILKDVPPFLWRFLPQIMAPFGKMVRVDETARLVPNLDARMLVSIKPGIDIPPSLNLDINGDTFVCPIEILGGLNACFLCKKEGHIRKNCPIISRRKQMHNSGETSINPQNVNNTQPPPPIIEIPKGVLSTDPGPYPIVANPLVPDRTPLASEPLIPISVPSHNHVDSPTDGFQLVISRKRRCKLTPLKALNPNHSSSSQLASSPKSLVLEQSPIKSVVRYMVNKLENPSRDDDASISNNPAMILRSGTPVHSVSSSLAGLTSDTSTINPSASNSLKEIEDNHIIEVIYANKGLEEIRSSTMLPDFPSSQLSGSDIGGNADTRVEPLETNEDDEESMKGHSLIKKKGRPMGSKNKKKSSDQQRSPYQPPINPLP